MIETTYRCDSEKARSPKKICAALGGLWGSGSWGSWGPSHLLPYIKVLTLSA